MPLSCGIIRTAAYESACGVPLCRMSLHTNTHGQASATSVPRRACQGCVYKRVQQKNRLTWTTVCAAVCSCEAVSLAEGVFSMLSVNAARLEPLAETLNRSGHSILLPMRKSRPEGVLFAEFSLSAWELSSEGICYARTRLAC